MTAKEIEVADKILIGCVLIRRVLSALNPFRKFTHGHIHVIARESANIAFTAMEYRKLYLLDGDEWWEQAEKLGFIKGFTRHPLDPVSDLGAAIKENGRRAEKIRRLSKKSGGAK